MPYPTVDVLEQLWNVFEIEVKKIVGQDYPNISDIQKLMTAQAVIDLSLHEIYAHAKWVHELTDKLINVKNNHREDKQIDKNIDNCCQLWLDILKKRNQIPLKIQHHQRLDGECDFRFSLQLMEGKPSGFKEIQVLDHKNS